jgi:hypothetical protein
MKGYDTRLRKPKRGYEATFWRGGYWSFDEQSTRGRSMTAKRVVRRGKKAARQEGYKEIKKYAE